MEANTGIRPDIVEARHAAGLCAKGHRRWRGDGPAGVPVLFGSGPDFDPVGLQFGFIGYFGHFRFIGFIGLLRPLRPLRPLRHGFPVLLRPRLSASIQPFEASL